MLTSPFLLGARDRRERILRIAVARMTVGSSVGVTTTLAAKVFGVPDEQLTPGARLIARLFGVRNCVLGAWALSMRDAGADEQRRCFQFNAAVDIADFVLLAPYLRQRELRRAAFLSLALATSATLAWVNLLSDGS
ncbi:MAG: hypothetical protein E6J45_06855 [Chloroflexi bacterium]|nr:MAG: hypothetical protein E6J45_06855 [Chloroflexota bacterium]